MDPMCCAGFPAMAEYWESGEKIVGHLIKHSEPFGTKIHCRDGIGIVKLTTIIQEGKYEN